MVYFAEYASRPWFGYPILDSRVWLEQAQALVSGEPLTRDFYFRPPLYAFFLAAITAVAESRTAFVATFVQLCLGAVFAVIVFACTRICWNVRAGVAAGIICALYAPLVFYEGEILSDSISLLFAGAFLLFWLLGVHRSHLRWFALAGIAAGLSAITRPNIVLVVALFAATALVRMLWPGKSFSSYNARFWLKSLSMLLAPFALLALIPTVHSAALGDPTFIASQGGINFWIGNHKGANGLNCVFPNVAEAESSGRYKDAVERYSRIGYLIDKHGQEQALVRFNEEGEQLKPSILSSYWYHRGFTFLLRNPAEALKIAGRKLLGLINNYEVRNNKEFYFVRDNLSNVLKFTPFTFGSLFMLAVPALWFGLGDTRRTYVVWVVLLTLAFAVSIVIFFVGGRLRLPLVLGLFPLAGITVDVAITCYKQKQFHRLAVIIASAAAAASFSFYHWPQVDFRYDPSQEPGNGIYATSHHGLEWAYLASALLDGQKYDFALQTAEKAIQLDRTLWFPYQVAANALERLDRDEEAKQMNLELLKHNPDNAITYNNLGALSEKNGDLQSAVYLYEHALRLNPYLPRTMGNLAMLHARSGHRTRALYYANRAVRFLPNLGTARAVLHVLESKPLPEGSPGIEKFVAEAKTPLPEKLTFHTPANKQLLYSLTIGTALAK